MCKYEKLELIADSIINGQTKQYKAQIKSLSMQDRARLVSALRTLINDKVAFEIAELCITKEF